MNVMKFRKNTTFIDFIIQNPHCDYVAYGLATLVSSEVERLAV